MVVKADEQFLARIGFAERWLGRARTQCAEGNLARSVLTLALADAEVHHALEAVGVPMHPRSRHAVPMALVLAATLASGLLLILGRPMGAGSAVTPPAPPVVRLASSSGALLEAIGPTDTAAAPQSGRGTAGPVPDAGRVTGRRSTPLNPSRPLEAPQATQRPSADTGSTRGIGSGSAHISTSELIDLMLTAERVLRRDATGQSSP